MSRALLTVALSVALTALVSAAFPSAFVDVITYTTSSCNSTTGASSASYGLDECVVLSATTSGRYSVLPATNALEYRVWNSSTSCAGTGTVVAFGGGSGTTVPNGASTCVNDAGAATSTRYVVPSANDRLWSVTAFSDTTCMTVATSAANGLPGGVYPNPKYTSGSDETCTSATLTAFTYVGTSALQQCTFGDGCTAPATSCVDITADACMAASVNGTARSKRYAYRLSNGAAGRVSLSAVALMALLALVTAAVTRRI